MQLRSCVKLSLTTALIAAALFIASPAAAESDTAWGLGPIALDNAYPLARIHVSASPISPEVKPADTLSLYSSFSWSNTFNVYKGHYSVDTEHRTFRLGGTYSPSDVLELSAELPIEYRGGGILDSLIDNWHTFFGLPRGGRNDVPENRFAVHGINMDETEYAFDIDGTKFGTAALGAKYLLMRGSQTEPALAAFAKVGLPTGADTYGHNGLDLLGGLSLSSRIESFIIYGSAAYYYFSDTEVAGVELSQHNASASLTVEYEATRNLSLLLGSTYYSNMVKSIENFPNYAFYLDFGLKYLYTNQTRLELLLRENPTPRLGSTDVTLHLGIAVDFEV
ncbi:MAG: DUF3187 family protein [Bdellovibrionales bacterium]|nr:DUF3187 family protein [Bdellovibrionales bacterium]